MGLMKRVGRALLPHPLLSLLLLVLWLLLNDSVAPGHILLGAALGLLIPWFTKRFWSEQIRVRRPLLALRMALLVTFDIIIANFQVAFVVLGPRKAVKPAFLRVPLAVKGDFSITVLAAVVSMTPGTVAAEVDPERRYLLVHALSEDDPEELARKIKTRYEKPIKEILAC